MSQISLEGASELVILHGSSCQKHQNPLVERSYQKLFVDSSWLNEQLLGTAVAGSFDWGLLVNSKSDKAWISSCLPQPMFRIFGMFCFAVRVYLQMRTLRSNVPSRACSDVHESFISSDMMRCKSNVLRKGWKPTSKWKHPGSRMNGGMVGVVR